MIRLTIFPLLLAAATLTGCEKVKDRFSERILNRPQGVPDLPPPPPERLARPTLAVLDDTSVIVQMDDGAQCLGSAGGSFASAGWTGLLKECPYPYNYQVALAAGTLPGIIQLDEVPATVLPIEEGEPPFRPLAVVTVTDSSGITFRFETAEGF